MSRAQFGLNHHINMHNTLNATERNINYLREKAIAANSAFLDAHATRDGYISLLKEQFTDYAKKRIFKGGKFKPWDCVSLPETAGLTAGIWSMPCDENFAYIDSDFKCWVAMRRVKLRKDGVMAVYQDGYIQPMNLDYVLSNAVAVQVPPPKGTK